MLDILLAQEMLAGAISSSRHLTQPLQAQLGMSDSLAHHHLTSCCTGAQKLLYNFQKAQLRFSVATALQEHESKAKQMVRAIAE